MNKRNLFKILPVFLILGILLACGGCVSTRVLSSTPPVKAIVVERAQEFSAGSGNKISLPAGEYVPVLEDDFGYYYEAPSKLAARGLFPYILEGGLVIKRGEKSPSNWYVIDVNANRHPLPATFQFRIVE
jgi:hypothetical protein